MDETSETSCRKTRDNKHTLRRHDNLQKNNTRSEISGKRTGLYVHSLLPHPQGEMRGQVWQALWRGSSCGTSGGSVWTDGSCDVGPESKIIEISLRENCIIVCFKSEWY